MSETGYVNKGFSSIGNNERESEGNQNKVPIVTEAGPSPTYSCHHPIRSMTTYLRHILGDTKLGVHILVCVFAIASWADLNSMWSELPQLVLNLPEGWDLPSYIIVISQVANIGPIIFVALAMLLPGSKSKLDKITSIVIIMSDIVAVLLVSFFWKHTSQVAGREHSTALLALNFVFALGDCTSSLAFYAFMSTMKPAYMATFFLGEGLSGMLPAFIALGQGVSDISCFRNSSVSKATYPNGTEYNKTNTVVYPMFGEPGFSVQVYFVIIAAILLCSGIAFILLISLTYCKSEMVSSATKKETPSSHEYLDMDDTSTSNNTNDVFVSTDVILGQSTENNTNSLSASKNSQLMDKIKDFLRIPDIPGWKFFIYMMITVVINMTLTTFLSSIQSYTTLPYGLDPYHLATNLAQITNPVACFLAVFVMTSSVSIIGFIFALGQAAVVYIIYTAAKSPSPPLHGQDDGGIMIVALWVVVTFLLIYAKVCVGGVMREHGRRELIWYGVATQVGSLIGAITGFLLVNNYRVFVDAPYC